MVTVASVEQTVAELRQRCAHGRAAAVCDDVLRALDPAAPAFGGVITESLAYSTLQAGPEFAAGWPNAARWRCPCCRTRFRPTVTAAQRVRFQPGAAAQRLHHRRPRRLAGGTRVARVDDSVTGGALRQQPVLLQRRRSRRKFGTFADPRPLCTSPHRHSPALVSTKPPPGSRVRCRLMCTARCSAADFKWPPTVVGCAATPRCGPGAARTRARGWSRRRGTVSITRRIGRWRTAYLVLSGRTIDAGTALAWGLVDEIG